MHEPNKSWDPGTLAPYMREGSTSCQEYDAYSKLRHLDIDQTQHHRLFQPSHPNRTGRGGRFGRGGGQSRNKDNSHRPLTADRNEVIREVLLNATVDNCDPTDLTATLAPGRCARIEEPGVMDSGANVSITNPISPLRSGSDHSTSSLETEDASPAPTTQTSGPSSEGSPSSTKPPTPF